MSGSVLDPDHPRLAPAPDRIATSIGDRRERRSRRPDENRHREDVIREVLTREGERLSQEVIRKLTSDLGVSRATAYRMIKTFRSCGAVTAPMTRPVGRPKGARVLEFGARDAHSRHDRDLLSAARAAEIQPARARDRQALPEGASAGAQLADHQGARARHRHSDADAATQRSRIAKQRRARCGRDQRPHGR